MLRTLFKRKCGNSDFRALLDDVRCEKSFAYKNLQKNENKFHWIGVEGAPLGYLCLNVRSATANRKKNRNVKQKRSRKSMNRTVFCQPDVPKDNWNIRSHENGVFSSNRAGISKKFNSVDSDELIRAWNEEQHVIWMDV